MCSALSTSRVLCNRAVQGGCAACCRGGDWGGKRSMRCLHRGVHGCTCICHYQAVDVRRWSHGMVELCCRLSSQQVRLHFCQERSLGFRTGRCTRATPTWDMRGPSMAIVWSGCWNTLPESMMTKSCTQRSLLVWCVCGAYAACGKAG